MLTYCAKTWNTTKKDKEQLRICKRRILTRILGPKKVDGIIRVRMNKEVDEELKGDNIIESINRQRLKWWGHIQRKKSTDPTKRSANWKPQIPKRSRRPRIKRT